MTLRPPADFSFCFQPFQWVVPGMVTGGEKRKSEKAR